MCISIKLALKQLVSLSTEQPNLDNPTRSYHGNIFSACIVRKLCSNHMKFYVLWYVTSIHVVYSRCSTWWFLYVFLSLLRRNQRTHWFQSDDNHNSIVDTFKFYYHQPRGLCDNVGLSVYLWFLCVSNSITKKVVDRFQWNFLDVGRYLSCKLISAMGMIWTVS